MFLRRENRNVKLESCVSFVYYITWVIFFAIYTHDPSYYSPCSQSSETYKWSVITFYLMIVSFIFLAIFVPVIVSNLKDTQCFLLALVFELLTLILSFVCYIELFIVYENEDCGDLTTLILVYIILSSIGT